MTMGFISCICLDLSADATRTEEFRAKGKKASVEVNRREPAFVRPTLDRSAAMRDFLK